jgi:ketosteroid isomerase-like protein
MMCTKNRTTLPRARANPSRRGRLSVLVLESLLALNLATLASAQTAEGGQMTDQEFKDFLVYQGALTVKKINEHSAGAVAARYWDDAIDISPSGIVSGRPAIERRLAEEFRMSATDFAETIDQAHISGATGWFIGHWSVTRLAGRRPHRITGYVAAVLERRNNVWKARLHVIGAYPATQGAER